MLISNQLVKYECPLVLGVQTLVSHVISEFPLMSSLIPRPTHVCHLQRKFHTTSDESTRPGNEATHKMPATDCVVGH